MKDLKLSPSTTVVLRRLALGASEWSEVEIESPKFWVRLQASWKAETLLAALQARYAPAPASLGFTQEVEGAVELGPAPTSVERPSPQTTLTATPNILVSSLTAEQLTLE